MSVSLDLPTSDGALVAYTLAPPRSWPTPAEAFNTRVAFAAAHVVADPLADNTPGRPAVLDWDATLAFRRHLWSYGFGVAEAMDTSQRGMGLGWNVARELIQRSSAAATECGGRIGAGVNTDQLEHSADLSTVIHAYEEQLADVEAAGAIPIIMASRQLAQVASSADDYRNVYDRVIAQASQPVILHWLGAMFDPALEGYWGGHDLDTATENFLDLVRDHQQRIDGVKISLLDADREIAIRAAMPPGVRLYTGDDFNFPELIAGDDAHHSDALLGIFAAIAPAASNALQALDRGDRATFDELLAPTVPLSRLLFETPTYNYKTGIAFMAWLTGHQPGFTMVAGMQSARSLMHLSEVFRRADRAGLLSDPELASHRMRLLLAAGGVHG
jgi:hypothetical protein